MDDDYDRKEELLKDILQQLKEITAALFIIGLMIGYYLIKHSG